DARGHAAPPLLAARATAVARLPAAIALREPSAVRAAASDPTDDRVSRRVARLRALPRSGRPAVRLPAARMRRRTRRPGPARPAELAAVDPRVLRDPSCRRDGRAGQPDAARGRARAR